MRHNKQEKGFIALFTTITALAIMMILALSMNTILFNRYRTYQNLIKSTQAYYAAETGIEDALVRLAKGKNWTNSYHLAVGDADTHVTVSNVFGGTRTVTGESSVGSVTRKVQVTYQLSGTSPGFFYGAHVGEGGLLMENSSIVQGNVFSNGNVTLKNSAKITDTALIAGSGNKISGGRVEGDVYADVCENVNVIGTLHANTVLGPSNRCLNPTTSGLPINPIDLPIADSQIEEWKSQAEAGGTIGSFNRTSGIHVLGPVKINGDLTIQNTAQLILNGTIWVTGKIDIKNSAKVSLHPSYGSLSGVIIGNGIIELQNSSVSSGSGESGSYLMYISTSSTNPAIIIKNSAKMDIVYSNTGWIAIENNTVMRSANAYGIHVKNSAKLVYEIGLENAFFTSGPEAGWVVTSWEEQ